MLFAIALVAGVAALLVTVLWYVAIYQTGNSSISGMMGQMMGNNPSSTQSALSMPSYVRSLIVVLIVVSALGVAGIAYFLIFPEIRGSPQASVHADAPLQHQLEETVSPKERGSKLSETQPTSAMTWPVLMKTSKPDERKVLEVLASHGGKYLQKLVVKESGLSKLKTHRIVSRFAERGIITVVKSGNTNEIALADWLHGNDTKT